MSIRVPSVYVCLFLLVWSGLVESKEPRDRPVVPEAKKMVLEVLVPTKQLTSEDVLTAMMKVPRAQFVSRELRSIAYADFALPIGQSQTISPPFIVAYMTETLDPQLTDKVLEIGTGSGYQAAVLGLLVDKVYTIEIVKPLGKKAQALLKKLKYDNVFCKVGDGYQGWPDAAPFDKIIVTCSPEAIPQPLVDQLKEGGKMLIPVGERYHQYFYLCTKKGKELEKEVLIPAFFVPMTGEAEDKRVVQPDPRNPSIVGGGFEKVNDGATGPEGWYYTRNVNVVPDENAPEGKNILVFDNLEIAREHESRLAQTESAQDDDRDAPASGGYTRAQLERLRHNQYLQEMTAHLLQPFPVDTRTIKKIDFSCHMKGFMLAPLGRNYTIPLVTITFFDEDWNFLEEQIVVATGAGSFDWKKFERPGIVVPRNAQIGSLRIGMIGGKGVLSVDDVVIRKSEK